MSRKVWYASYGSNLSRERFMRYIQGGRVPGADFEQVGCTDPSPPTEERRILILHPLFFAEAMPQWENSGVAFIEKESDEEAKTLGRMYLISEEQFREVILQENGHRRMDADLSLDLEETIREGRSEIQGELYGTLLYLGEEDGYPIFTFTASWEPDQAPVNRPGPRYLTLIAEGLKETYGLTDQGVMDYLRDVPGVSGKVSEGELAGIVGSTRGGDFFPAYPTSFT